MKEKVIAVVGRPNVGKSTLINRIAGKRLSIVDDIPNITRDRIYIDGSWQGKNFVLIDTGGLTENDKESDFIGNINAQADIAIDESDLILFLVDGKSGLNPYDYDVANKLRQTKKEVIVVVNKIDSVKEEGNASEFWALGFKNLITVSALHGDVHVGDLLDIITKDIEINDEEKFQNDAIKIAIIGKPNAGKSSILNNLLNKNRAIVSPVSGTTRDAIDEEIIFENEVYRLIDTAGIRKKSKVDYGVEMFAVDRAIRAIKECDVALLVIDCVEGLSDQDKKIASIVETSGVGLILAFNKWDLIKNTQTQTFEKEINKQAPFLNYARKIYISAKTGQRLDNIFKVAKEVNLELNKRISTGLLNKTVNEAVSLNPPASIKGRFLKIYYTTQAKAHPPTFVIFVNNKNLVQDHYKRYLNKKLRENFGFFGVPIVVSYREKKDK